MDSKPVCRLTANVSRTRGLLIFVPRLIISLIALVRSVPNHGVVIIYYSRGLNPRPGPPCALLVPEAPSDRWGVGESNGEPDPGD